MDTLKLHVFYDCISEHFSQKGMPEPHGRCEHMIVLLAYGGIQHDRDPDECSLAHSLEPCSLDGDKIENRAACKNISVRLPCVGMSKLHGPDDRKIALSAYEGTNVVRALHGRIERILGDHGKCSKCL